MVLRFDLLIQNLTIDGRLSHVPKRDFTKVADIELFWVFIRDPWEVDDVTNLFDLLILVELLSTLFPFLYSFLIRIKPRDILMHITFLEN